MRRPGRPVEEGDVRGVKTTPEKKIVAGLRGAEGAPVIPIDGKYEAPVPGVPLVAAVDGKGDGPEVDGLASTAVKRKYKAEKDEDGVRWLKHYSSMQSILIVGDGDFSFSLALATAFGSSENLVATSLDSFEALMDKYSKARFNVIELKKLGATVLHDLDAKKIRLHTDLATRRFDRIVFNFPHAGFKGNENQVHVINSHKELVRHFFSNVCHLLRPYGEVHVSHKTGYPYDTWDIKQLAAQSSLIMVDKVIFNKQDYPGYNQKRGDGAKCDQPFALGSCCTFKFCIGDVKKLKKQCGNRSAPISSYEGSSIYPGISGIDSRPLDPAPVIPAWSLSRFHPVNAVLEPYPYGVPQMGHPHFLVNSYSTERAHFVHHQETIFSHLRPPLPTEGGTPLIRRIRSTPFPAPPDQPSYQERTNAELRPRGDYSYNGWEHQSRLHREYEIPMQVMPRGTSLCHLSVLEDRYRQSVERRMHLERLIARYGV